MYAPLPLLAAQVCSHPKVCLLLALHHLALEFLALGSCRHLGCTCRQVLLPLHSTPWKTACCIFFPVLNCAVLWSNCNIMDCCMLCNLFFAQLFSVSVSTVELSSQHHQRPRWDEPGCLRTRQMCATGGAAAAAVCLLTVGNIGLPRVCCPHCVLAACPCAAPVSLCCCAYCTPPWQGGSLCLPPAVLAPGVLCALALRIVIVKFHLSFVVLTSCFNWLQATELNSKPDCLN